VLAQTFNWPAGESGGELLLPYGRGAIEVDLPEPNVEAILTPSERPEVADDRAEIARCLNEPISAPPLRELVKPGSKVTIVASDITRPCPSSKVLPPLLSELRDAGVGREDVTILLATGTHRGHSAEERVELLGPEIVREYRVIDHDCNDRSSLQYVGTTRRGTEVRLNRRYLEADVKIAIANVELHYFAGYSGGPKSIIPGIAAFETINRCHSMMVEPKATSGAAEGNPVFEDILEGVSMAPPDLIVNVVLNQGKGMVGIFCGHFLEAHRKARALVDAMYKVRLGRRADAVIVSAGGFPKDINLYQAEKAMENAQRAVREGGAMLLIAECPDGFGHETFRRWVFEARDPEEVIARLGKGFIIGGHKAFATMRILKHCDVYLKSSIEPGEVRRAMLKPVEPGEFVGEVLRRYGAKASFVVMPYGGSTLPVVQDP